MSFGWGWHCIKRKPFSSMWICVNQRVDADACIPSHLFGVFPLHLRGAWRWSPEHAGSNANWQVEGVHLVVVGVALDTVQHSDHMSKQEQVFTGQEVKQPVREEETDGRKVNEKRLQSAISHHKATWYFPKQKKFFAFGSDAVPFLCLSLQTETVCN